MSISNHFLQEGSGSPIVFVHGSYATTSTWKKMIEQLSQQHTCIAIKLPGHCGTPDPEDFANPSVETELDLIERVVRHVTDEPIHLVGHSYGGVVTLSQALKGTLPIEQLTLFEPVATWVLDLMGDTEMQARVDAFLARYREDAANNVPYACGQVIDFWGGGNDFEPLPAFVKDAMAPLLGNNLRHWDLCTGIQHSRAELQNLTIPTRIVCGSRSNAVAHAIADHLHRELPHSKRYEVEGASHAMVTSHPADCLAILRDDLGQPR
ncbi:MAG TPA: alpha/beta hydrolase [Aquabacterium sp.]|nr:alpha/beta hydrolase [Aquabacterium sp.]